ncbi:MAG: response regulator [Bryobacteraceae bacterium]
MPAAPEPSRTLPLLRRAVSCAQHGNKTGARELLRELLAEDPENEAALVLAAEIAATPAEAEFYLSEVLRINPSNSQAITTLAMLRLVPALAAPPEDLAATSAIVQPPHPDGPVHWECPLCLEGARIKETVRCPNCGAILAIENLDRLQTNRGVDEFKLQEAMERLSGTQRGDVRFEPNLNMARVLLNLNRSGEALPFLHAACRANPVATGLKMLYDTLARRPVVLAADESPVVRRIISILVARAGYLPLSASDGLEAVSLLDTWSPSMMFVGAEMARMSGYEVCELIRDTPDLRNIPVIILFDKDGFFVKMRGAMAGATDYLVKPVDENALAQLMVRHAPKGEMTPTG